MDSTPKTILKIKKAMPELHGKYKVLANQIIFFPEKFITKRAKDIALECDCDESLVVRFCQKMGYKGLPDLKASIVAEFMPLGASPKKNLPKGSFESIKHDFLEKNTMALCGTSDMLEEEGMNKAVSLLASSRRIFVIGVGASGFVALDAQAKLMRLGFHVVHQADPSLLLIVAGLAGEGDTLLAISYSGETRDVCRAAKHFKDAGGNVISICKNPSTRLGKLSDIVFSIASDEGIFRLGAMTSRLSQMFVVDMIVLFIAMHDMDKSQESILKTNAMIEGSKRP